MPSAACAQTTAASTAAPIRNVRPSNVRQTSTAMEQRDGEKSVGDHAMIELHGERVLEGNSATPAGRTAGPTPVERARRR